MAQVDGGAETGHERIAMCAKLAQKRATLPDYVTLRSQPFHFGVLPAFARAELRRELDYGLRFRSISPE